jgi:hypothetical protein
MVGQFARPPGDVAIGAYQRGSVGSRAEGSSERVGIGGSASGACPLAPLPTCRHSSSNWLMPAARYSSRGARNRTLRTTYRKPCPPRPMPSASRMGPAWPSAAIMYAARSVCSCPSPVQGEGLAWGEGAAFAPGLGRAPGLQSVSADHLPARLSTAIRRGRSRPGATSGMRAPSPTARFCCGWAVLHGVVSGS